MHKVAVTSAYEFCRAKVATRTLYERGADHPGAIIRACGRKCSTAVARVALPVRSIYINEACNYYFGHFALCHTSHIVRVPGTVTLYYYYPRSIHVCTTAYAVSAVLQSHAARLSGAPDNGVHTDTGTLTQRTDTPGRLLVPGIPVLFYSAPGVTFQRFKTIRAHYTQSRWCLLFVTALRPLRFVPGRSDETRSHSSPGLRLASCFFLHLIQCLNVQSTSRVLRACAIRRETPLFSCACDSRRVTRDVICSCFYGRYIRGSAIFFVMTLTFYLRSSPTRGRLFLFAVSERFLDKPWSQVLSPLPPGIFRLYRAWGSAFPLLVDAGRVSSFANSFLLIDYNCCLV